MIYETILDRIRAVIEHRAAIHSDIRMPIPCIALLLEDPRMSGPALVDALDQQIRLAIGATEPVRTRQEILNDLAACFELQNRLRSSSIRLTQSVNQQDAIQKLRDWFPWPAQPYAGITTACDAHFTVPSTATTLTQVIRDRRPSVVLELGVWLGGTTRIFVDAEVPTVISVDTWLGSEEHQLGSKWAHEVDNPEAMVSQLYDQFIANLWDRREQIVPMRTTTIAAMHVLDHFRLTPDLVFLDASHDQVSVETELDLAEQLFPHATIVCDDYAPGEAWLEGLVRAANSFAKRTHRELVFCEGNSCVILPNQSDMAVMK